MKPAMVRTIPLNAMDIEGLLHRSGAIEKAFAHTARL